MIGAIQCHGLSCKGTQRPQYQLLTLPARVQIMDKLDDPRKKRLEELLQQAHGGGTASAAGTAPSSTARPSSIPSPRVSASLINMK